MKGLKIIYTIWLREFITFMREKFRIIAMIGQPLLYLLVLGKGINAGMTLNGAPGVGYISFMYPGIIGMSILFTSMFSAISIIWDREFGFMKEVLVAPVPRWAVALGKSMGGATIAMIQSAILICMAPLAGISLSVLVVIQMLVLAFLISFAITSFFVAVASRMQSMQSFQVVMNFIVMPLYFLSGAMFPMSSAPAWMRSLMTLNPLTYGVDAFRNVVFSQTMISTAGAPVSLLQMAQNGGLVRWGLSFDLVVMAFFATVLAAAGAWAFSKAS